MAAYSYQALDQRGKKQRGILEADSARQIRQQLRERGWFVETVEVSNKAAQKQGSGLFSPGLSVDDLALLTRQLATLIGSGMPLEECLKAVADQADKSRVRSLVLGVRAKVLEGFSLAAALKEYPRAFPVLYQATINAGEHSGHLDLVLERLADYVEDQQTVRRQIQMASVYPTILVLVAIGIIIFLLKSVVPQIVDAITAGGGDLPTPTVILLAASAWVQAYWLHSLITALLLYGVWVLFNRSPARRLKTHRLLLSLPLIGRISRGFNSARFMATVAMLSSSGVPLVEAIKIAAEVISNLHIRQRVAQAAVSVSEGGTFYVALQEVGCFRPLLLHMIGSGEASGELDRMLDKAATAEDRQIKDLINTLLGLLEPLMLIVMGGIVLVIVLAIVLPIMQMNTMTL